MSQANLPITPGIQETEHELLETNFKFQAIEVPPSEQLTFEGLRVKAK
jgi:hypothetical protein